MRDRARRLALARCLVPAVAVLVAGGIGVAWAQYGGRTMTRTPDHGKPGTVIDVTGTGCEENGKPYGSASLTVFYKADPQRSNNTATTPVRDDGTFEGTVAVPADAPPGAYVVSVDCLASDMAHQVGREPFTVDGPSSTPTPTPSRSPSPPPHRSPTPTPTPSATHHATPTPSRTPSPSPSRSAKPSASVPAATAHVTATPVAADAPTRDGGRGAAAVAALALLAANVTGLARVRAPRGRAA